MRSSLIWGLLAAKSNIRTAYRQQKTWQFLPHWGLAEIQESNLRNLLTHACKQVPYYRELFNHHDIVKDSEFHLKNFSALPPLTKDIIRSQGDRMHAQDKVGRAIYKNSSGGSTGAPLELIQDKQYKDTSWAHKILYNEMLGKHVGDREIKLWGSERDILKGKETLSFRAQNALFNRRLLNSFRMSKEDMERYVGEINVHKPISIWAYVDSAYELAKFIKAGSLPTHAPKAIILTAGTVHPEVKEFISGVFKAPVYNQYGSREVGDMAVECPAKDGLHVYDYLYKFEILDQDLKPCPIGQTGEIYVTVLSNYAMPLIRYRIGDTASWRSFDVCKCGRSLPRINDVHGRVTDHFITTKGELIHGEYFTHLFYFKEWVKKFQVRQVTKDHVRCSVVLPDSHLDRPKGVERSLDDARDGRDEIETAIKKVMGDHCRVEWDFTDEIPPTKSGKYLFTVSDIR